MAARLLRSWVRIPPGAWMFLCCECCVLSGRGLCDELITRPEESYRLWCVVVRDLETSRMRRPWPALGRSATGWKRKTLWKSNNPTQTNTLQIKTSELQLAKSEDGRTKIMNGTCWSLHERQKNALYSTCFYSGIHKSLSSYRHKNRRPLVHVWHH